MNTQEKDYDITLNLVVTVTWEESSDHCCEADPYPLRRPIRASCGEYEYVFGLEPENAVEDAILAAITSGEIE